jgi:hypothetical protein
MKKSLLIFSVLTLNTLAWASENPFIERAKKKYLEVDKNYSLDCLYGTNSKFQIIYPTNDTKKTATTLERSFNIETDKKVIPMKFVLKRDGRNYQYEITFNNKATSSGPLKLREFQLNPITDTALANEIDLPRLNCQVNLAYEHPYYLTDGNYHFNVHPHLRYDWMRKLKEPTEAYLNNPRYESLILLETTNYRGNSVNLNDFFDGVDYRLKQTEMDLVLSNVPEDVPLVVSPAGNSEYIFDVDKELNIVFTGGNHNYCIWNATRHVILGLLRSKSNAVINFRYDSAAIVAQRKGVEGLGLDFPKSDHSRSNLLKDLLQNKSIIDRYHRNWLWYFQNTLGNRYVGQYKTYTINYKAPGWEKTVTMNGNGSRDLVVNITIF